MTETNPVNSGISKLALVGYGKMGRLLEQLAPEFGFEVALIVENPDGSIGHSEMSFAGATVNVGGEWADWAKSPASLGGANSQTIEVGVDADIDAHYERARAAGDLRADTDPHRIGEFLVASIEGGILLAKVHKSPEPLEAALRAAEAHVASLRTHPE